MGLLDDIKNYWNGGPKNPPAPTPAPVIPPAAQATPTPIPEPKPSPEPLPPADIVIIKHVHNNAFDGYFKLKINPNLDMSPTATPNNYGVTPLSWFVGNYEGLHLSPYKCQAGVNTIGFGQTGDIASNVDLKTAFNNLHNDIVDKSTLLGTRYKDRWNGLSKTSQGILTSLSFNAGNFGDDLSAAIDNCDVDAINANLQKYDKYKDPKTKGYKYSEGLHRRRDNEGKFISGDTEGAIRESFTYYNLLDRLVKSDISPHEIGQILQGIAKVETVDSKGNAVDISASLNTIPSPLSRTHYLTTPPPVIPTEHTKPADLPKAIAAIKPKPTPEPEHPKKPNSSAEEKARQMWLDSTKDNDKKLSEAKLPKPEHPKKPSVHKEETASKTPTGDHDKRLSQNTTHPHPGFNAPPGPGPGPGPKKSFNEFNR